MKRVSVVVLSWNTEERTAECLRSVAAAFARGEAEGELIVVENGSEDGSGERIAREFPAARLVRNAANQGYSAGVNQGVALATGEGVLLLGSDAVLTEGALAGLVEFLDGAEGYGACAPRLVGADGVTQRACHAFPLPRTALWFGTPLERWFPASAELERYFLRGFDHEHDADVVQPPATCLLLRREVWERLGGMDVALWLFYSDVDLCQRMAELGLRVRYLAGLVVRHAQGASTARYGAFVERWHTDRLRYLRKHHGLIGAACARLGTSWAFAGWGLQRALGRAQDPFWERVASYLRFLRA